MSAPPDGVPDSETGAWLARNPSASGADAVYHDDPRCPRLGGGPRPASEPEVRARRRCSWCGGYRPGGRGDCNEAVRALLAADPDEHPGGQR